jgi:hypothetical protein
VSVRLTYYAAVSESRLTGLRGWVYEPSNLLRLGVAGARKRGFQPVTEFGAPFGERGAVAADPSTRDLPGLRISWVKADFHRHLEVRNGPGPPGGCGSTLRSG